TGQNFATEPALSNARRSGDRYHDRGFVLGAALVCGDDLRKLRFATQERGAASGLASARAKRCADQCGPVAAHLELESPACELGGGGIGEHLRRFRAMSETGCAVHHLADRAAELQLGTTGGDADLGTAGCQCAAELE